MAEVKDILQEYVATANNPQYKSDWNIINSKFPELKGYDAKLLQEYVATANNPKYNSNFETINSKFPELFSQQQQAIQPTQTTTNGIGVLKKQLPFKAVTDFQQSIVDLAVPNKNTENNPIIGIGTPMEKKKQEPKLEMVYSATEKQLVPKTIPNTTINEYQVDITDNSADATKTQVKQQAQIQNDVDTGVLEQRNKSTYQGASKNFKDKATEIAGGDLIEYSKVLGVDDDMLSRVEDDDKQIYQTNEQLKNLYANLDIYNTRGDVNNAKQIQKSIDEAEKVNAELMLKRNSQLDAEILQMQKQFNNGITYTKIPQYNVQGVYTHDEYEEKPMSDDEKTAIKSQIESLKKRKGAFLQDTENPQEVFQSLQPKITMYEKQNIIPKDAPSLDKMRIYYGIKLTQLKELKKQSESENSSVLIQQNPILKALGIDTEKIGTQVMNSIKQRFVDDKTTKSIQEIEGELNAIAPILANNLSPNTKKSGFWKTAKNEFVDALSATTTNNTSQDNAQFIQKATQEAGVNLTEDRQKELALQQKGKDYAQNNERFGQTIGNTAEFALEFGVTSALGEGLINYGAKLLKATLPAKAYVGLNMANNALRETKLGNLVLGATDEAIKYEVAGALNKQLKDDATASQGATGFLGSELGEKFAKPIATLFGANGGKFVSLLGDTFGRTVVELFEETGQNTAQLVNQVSGDDSFVTGVFGLFKDSEKGKEFISKLKENYSDADENVQFVASIFAMSFAFNAGKFGKFFTDLALKKKEELSETDKEKVDVIIDDLSNEYTQAQQKAVEETAKAQGKTEEEVLKEIKQAGAINIRTEDFGENTPIDKSISLLPKPQIKKLNLIEKGKEKVLSNIANPNTLIEEDKIATYNGAEVTILDDLADGEVVINTNNPEIGNDGIITVEKSALTDVRNKPKDIEQLQITSAVININGKEYEGKNHAEAILKAQADGQDISQVDRQSEGLFKLSDGTIINREQAKEQFGQDRSELIIPQDEVSNQANVEYKRIQDEQKNPITPVEPINTGQEVNNGAGIQQVNGNGGEIQQGSGIGQVSGQAVPTEKVEEKIDNVEIKKLQEEIDSFDDEYNRLVDAVNKEDRKLNTPKSENEIKLNQLQDKINALIDKRNKLQEQQTPIQQSGEVGSVGVGGDVKVPILKEEPKIENKTGIKSVLDSDVDLKGEVKPDWMHIDNEEKVIPISELSERDMPKSMGGMSISDALKNIENGKPTKSKGAIEVLRNVGGKYLIRDGYHRVADAIKSGGNEIKGVVKNTEAVKSAIKNNKYQKAIEEGRMTAKDAVKIIESAGLKVPQNILEQSLKETTKAEKQKKVEQVSAEQKLKNDKHDRMVGLMREYNSTPTNKKTRKSEIRQSINKLASDLGYTVKGKTGDKIDILNAKGKVIRKINITSDEVTVTPEVVEKTKELAQGWFEWNGNELDYHIDASQLGLTWQEIRRAKADIDAGKTESTNINRVANAINEYGNMESLPLVRGFGGNYERIDVTGEDLFWANKVNETTGLLSDYDNVSESELQSLKELSESDEKEFEQYSDLYGKFTNEDGSINWEEALKYEQENGTTETTANKGAERKSGGNDIGNSENSQLEKEEKDLDLQSTAKSFTPIDKTAFEKLLDKLKKAFPNVKVELFGKGNMESAKKALEKYGVDIVDMLSVWHGSPHNFDKFSTDKMGTGEGAQAFGWGLYFTDLESIARNYANNLANLEIVNAPKDINDDLNKIFTKVNNPFKGKSDYITKEELESFLSKVSKYAEGEQYGRGEDKQLFDLVDNVWSYVQDNYDTIEIKANKNLYKVKLHEGKTPSEYTWLEWDKPVDKSTLNNIANKIYGVKGESILINSNSGTFKTIFEKNEKGITTSYLYNENTKEKVLANKSNERYNEIQIESIENTLLKGQFNQGKENGESFYKEVSKIIGSPKQGSLFLLENGIDGIKYPAESIARGATSDNARGFNYVVFDENAIKIEEKIQFLKTKDGTIYGFKTPDGKVFINTDNLNANTPIHEFGHIWQSVFPQEFARGIELLKLSPQGQALIREIQKNPAYKGKSLAEIQAEALVTAIGNKGESIFNSNPTLFNKFKEWLSDFFKKLGDKLGIKDLSADDKLNIFTKKVTGELLGGKVLSKEVGKSTNIDLQMEGDKKAINEAYILAQAYLEATDFEYNTEARDEFIEKVRNNPLSKAIFTETQLEKIYDGQVLSSVDKIRVKYKMLIYDIKNNNRLSKQQIQQKQQEMADDIKWLINNNLKSITGKQAEKFINLANKAVTNNSPAYLARIINQIANLADQRTYQKAKTLYEIIKARSKRKGGVQSGKLTGVLQDFATINPLDVSDIAKYVELAEKVKQASNVVKQPTDADSDLVYDEVQAYVKAQQDEINSNAINDTLEDDAMTFFTVLDNKTKAKFGDDKTFDDLNEAQQREVLDSITKDDIKKYGLTDEERDMVEAFKEIKTEQKRQDFITETYVKIGELKDLLANSVGVITQSPAEKEITDALLNVKLDDMTATEMARVLKLINGITQNNDYSGGGAFVAQQKSVEVNSKMNTLKSEIGEFRKLSEGGSKFRNFQQISVAMAKGKKLGAKLMEASGINNLMRGIAKTKTYSHNLQKAFKAEKFKSSVFEPISQMRQSIYAAVIQTKIGDDVKEAEHIERWKRIIEKNIENLRTINKDGYKEQAELLQKALDEVIGDRQQLKDIADNMSKVDSEGKRVVQFFTDNHAEQKPRFRENSLLFHNKEIEEYNSYTKLSITSLTGDTVRDTGEKLMNDARSTGITKKKSKSMIDRANYESLNDNTGLDFNFINKQMKALGDNEYDINTSADITTLANAFNSDNKQLRELLGAENFDLLKKKLQTIVGTSKYEETTIVDDVINEATKISRVIALGSITQALKQATVLLSTYINSAGTDNLRGVDFKLITGTQREKDNLHKLMAQSEIGARRAESAGGFYDNTSIKKNISDGFAKKTAKYFGRGKDFASNVSMGLLRWADIKAADLSWVTFYKKYLRDNNLTFDENNEFKNPNKDAMAYAETMVQTAQGANTEAGQADLWNMAKGITQMVFPFMSFAIQGKARLVDNLMNIANGDDRVEALRDTAGYIGEQLAFNKIKLLIGIAVTQQLLPLLLEALELGDDDDDRLNKEQKENKKLVEGIRKEKQTNANFWNNIIKDLTYGTAPLIDNNLTIPLINGIVNWRKAPYDLLTKGELNKTSNLGLIPEYKSNDFNILSGGTIGVGVNQIKNLITDFNMITDRSVFGDSETESQVSIFEYKGEEYEIVHNGKYTRTDMFFNNVEGRRDAKNIEIPNDVIKAFVESPSDFKLVKEVRKRGGSNDNDLKLNLTEEQKAYAIFMAIVGVASFAGINETTLNTVNNKVRGEMKKQVIKK